MSRALSATGYVVISLAPVGSQKHTDLTFFCFALQSQYNGWNVPWTSLVQHTASTTFKKLEASQLLLCCWLYSHPVLKSRPSPFYDESHSSPFFGFFWFLHFNSKVVADSLIRPNIYKRSRHFHTILTSFPCPLRLLLVWWTKNRTKNGITKPKGEVSSEV